MEMIIDDFALSLICAVILGIVFMFRFRRIYIQSEHMEVRHPHREPKHLGEKAVVLGGSIAGLCAAKILTKYFSKVIVLERDRIDESLLQKPGPRLGTPHATQIHVILPSGLACLEKIFPGIIRNLTAQGAELVNYGTDLLWSYAGTFFAQYPTPMSALTCSRQLLEHELRAMVRLQANVEIHDKCTVTGVIPDETHTKVVGVEMLTSTHTPHTSSSKVLYERAASQIYGDFFVDALGMNSHANKYLCDVFPRYDGVHTDSHRLNFGYARRFYECTQPLDWKLRAVFPSPMETRMCFLAKQEQPNRYIVQAGGYIGDCPPSERKEFEEFLHSIGNVACSEFLRCSKPVSDVVAYRYPVNSFRRYEKLDFLPGHLIHVGDAIASFNPVYGQGMTVAMKQIISLDEDLLHCNTLTDVNPIKIQRHAAAIAQQAWLFASMHDLVFPQIEAARPFWFSLLQKYTHAVLCAMDIPAVHRIVIRVLNLDAGALEMFRPTVLFFVLMKALLPAAFFPQRSDITLPFATASSNISETKQPEIQAQKISAAAVA